jgi:kynurenine formamidase
MAATRSQRFKWRGTGERPHYDNTPGSLVVFLRQRRLPGETPPEASSTKEADDLIAALAFPQEGTVFDLDAGRWPGMPVLDVHPPYIQTTYRTPRGAAIDGDLQARYGPNSDEMGVITELFSASTHTGTHIDALCHITIKGQWFGGGSESSSLGDFGARIGDAASIAPIICRGVLMDIPALLQVDVLAAGQKISKQELEAALERQQIRLAPGDAVLVRTGYMTVWSGEESRRAQHYGAGIDRTAAAWLADHRPCLVGADTENLDQIPSSDLRSPLPAHDELLVKRGIHIIELLYLEALAEAAAYEFLFICLPLRLRGATGSMVRPIAVI